MRLLRNLLTLLGLLAPVLYIVYAYPALPASLPSHFDAAGHANRYAPKAVVWLIPAVAAGLALLITVAARFPRVFNLPAQPGNPARPRQEALAVELFAWLRLEIVWLLAYIDWSVVRVANRQTEYLGKAFLAIAMLTVLGTIVLFLRRMIRPSSV